jgi:hypothetical protein
MDLKTKVKVSGSDVLEAYELYPEVREELVDFIDLEEESKGAFKDIPHLIICRGSSHVLSSKKQS